MSQGSLFNPFSDGQYWYNPSTIGVRLNVPIMKGSMNNNQLAYHQLEKEKKELMREQNDEFVQMMLSNAQSDLEIHQLVLEEKKLNLDLQKRINFRKKEMLQNELIGITEFLESNAAVASAEMEFSEAIFNYTMVQLELLKSMGMLKMILMN